MIGRLTGTVVECAPDRMLLDVGGVGYVLHVPLSTYYAFSDVRGSSCSLYVHTHVREDALQLFGFASREERATFEQLIGISGVGPRMALAILSGIGVEELRHAVLRKDRGRLQKIPGVGRKTAERVLLELEDKLARGATADDRRESPMPRSAPGSPSEDARSALVNLGYSVDAARRAVGGALEDLGPEAVLESVLKAALARLVR